MEYIPGPNLRSIMPPEGFQGNEMEIRNWIQDFFLSVLDGVQKLHDLGIIHRDLKPENVLLDEFTPKLADFGLAGGPRWRKVTRSHHMDGTIPYMSREQIEDMGETDFRGDIYALGKILYEATMGKMGKDTTFPFKTAHLPNPDTPFLKRLDRIIQQATAEDKKKRIPSAKVLRKALIQLLEDTGEVLPQPKVSRLRRSPVIAMTALVLIAFVSIAFHVLYHREKTSAPTLSSSPSLQDSHPEPSRKDKDIFSASPSKISLSPTLQGNDGVTLHLIPQGKLILPEKYGSSAEKSFTVSPFYMDETEVTNHQYVEFLNQAISRVRVEEGVVKGDGQIWLLLGEVMEGYEPIIFQNGRFLLKDPSLAAYPVVRVTAHGATAYAQFYGKRLPTEVEWLYARKEGTERLSTSLMKAPQAGADVSHTHTNSKMMDMMCDDEAVPSPAAPQTAVQGHLCVTKFQPNKYGIKGLDGNVSEWAGKHQTSFPRSGKEGEEEYMESIN